jgi:hypothetical protein
VSGSIYLIKESQNQLHSLESGRFEEAAKGNPKTASSSPHSHMIAAASRLSVKGEAVSEICNQEISPIQEQRKEIVSHV